MLKLNLELINKKETVISCDTEEKAKNLLKLLSENGFLWCDNEEINPNKKTNWESYCKYTVYYLEKNKTISYGSLRGGFYENNISYTKYNYEDVFIEEVEEKTIGTFVKNIGKIVKIELIDNGIKIIGKLVKDNGVVLVVEDKEGFCYMCRYNDLRYLTKEGER